MNDIDPRSVFDLHNMPRMLSPQEIAREEADRVRGILLETARAQAAMRGEGWDCLIYINHFHAIVDLLYATMRLGEDPWPVLREALLEMNDATNYYHNHLVERAAMELPPIQITLPVGMEKFPDFLVPRAWRAQPWWRRAWRALVRFIDQPLAGP